MGKRTQSSKSNYFGMFITTLKLLSKYWKEIKRIKCSNIAFSSKLLTLKFQYFKRFCQYDALDVLYT